MAAINDIVSWSKKIPRWQQDALRRLLSSSVLSDSEIAELTDLCKTENGLFKRGKAHFRPIKESDIPTASVNSRNVALKEIQVIEGVNALTQNDSIKFKEKGLTVIYGGNASGKSGYARIVKNTTRSRSSEYIHSNIYSKEESKPIPKAKIIYSVNGEEQPQVEWIYGTSPTPDLSAVSFFDSDCAHEYVEKDASVAYRPFGLDLLDKLARVIDSVKQAFEAELASLRSAYTSIVMEGNTQASSLITDITYDTKYSDIKDIAILSREENAKLRTLRTQTEAIKNKEIGTKLFELTTKRDNLLKLLENLADIKKVLALKKVNELISLSIKLQKLQNIAEKAAKKKFYRELPNIGSEEWKLLWEAARIYSNNKAYPHAHFPNIDDDSRCVLCHQVLTRKAKKRMTNLESFITNHIEQEIVQCRKQLDEGQDKLRLLDLKCLELNLSSILKPRSLKKVIKFLESTEAYRDKLLQILCNAKIKHKRVKILPPLSTISKEISTINKRIDYYKSLEKPDEFIKMQSELKELEARNILKALLPQIKTNIEILKKIHKFESIIKSINTAGVSRYSGELSKKYVTDTLANNFRQELSKLRLRNIKVTLNLKQNVKGVAYHQILISSAYGNIPIDEITSDGEHRCIALAGFLTELTTADHTSGIVFDDPVTSLDHDSRENIASRLVEEAKQRQVIIFTHDSVFLMYLLEISTQQHVDRMFYEIYSKNGTTGIPRDGIPWGNMSSRDRLTKLRDYHAKLVAEYPTLDEDLYRMKVEFIYGKLRETWERAIEEHLFKDTIQRARFTVETRRLKDVIINTDDYKIIQSSMSRCSTYLSGHDKAVDVNHTLPTTTEMLQDIDILQKWIKDITKRVVS